MQKHRQRQRRTTFVSCESMIYAPQTVASLVSSFLSVSLRAGCSVRSALAVIFVVRSLLILWPTTWVLFLPRLSWHTERQAAHTAHTQGPLGKMTARQSRNAALCVLFLFGLCSHFHFIPSAFPPSSRNDDGATHFFVCLCLFCFHSHVSFRFFLSRARSSSAFFMHRNCWVCASGIKWAAVD